MPIVFLKPTSETDANNLIVAGVLGDVDEGVSGADAALETSKTGTWSGTFAEWTLEDLPGDASSINSVILRVRGQVAGGWTDDSVQYFWAAFGTNLAHPTLQWDFETEDGDALTNKQQTVTDSPTVANVNAATIRTTQAYSASMQGDGSFSAWDAFELEVDYETSGVTSALGTSTLAGELLAAGYSQNDALGTVSISGELLADAVHMARGTITVLGEGLSEATHLAQATTTLLGELAGIGTDISGAGGDIPIFFYHYQHHK